MKTALFLLPIAVIFSDCATLKSQAAETAAPKPGSSLTLGQTMNFDTLLNLVSIWAEKEAARISATGRPLTNSEIEIARKVGVKSPELIRVLLVDQVPFPDDPTIMEVGKQVGLTSEHTAGMTLGYGIFIRIDQKERSDIWPHEFRHVAQYECFGSIKAFMFFYLKELLHFKYGSGPLEIDAKNAGNGA